MEVIVYTRLILTSDGVGFKSRNRSRKGAHDLVKIKQRSRKPNVIEITRIKKFLFSFDCAYGSVVYDLVITRLSEWQVEAN